MLPERGDPIGPPRARLGTPGGVRIIQTCGGLSTVGKAPSATWAIALPRGHLYDWLKFVLGVTCNTICTVFYRTRTHQAFSQTNRLVVPLPNADSAHYAAFQQPDRAESQYL